MPATELTEERKHDLAVLQMRKVLDPKRFYKAHDLKAAPKYFQVVIHFTCHNEARKDIYTGIILSQTLMGDFSHLYNF